MTDLRVRTGWAAYRVVHVALPLVLLTSGFALGLFVLLDKTPANCAYDQDYLPNVLLFAIGISAIFLGRYFGRLDQRATAKATEPSRRTSRLLIMGAFALSTVVWFCEALGTAHVAIAASSKAAFEPITFYIRCAIYRDISGISGGAFTIALIVIICFLMGEWFWAEYRPGKGGRSEADVRKTT